MTKSRIFLFLLIAFITGVAVHSFVFVPPVAMGFLAFAGTITVVWGMVRQQKMIIIAGFLLIAALLGVVRFDYEERSHPDLSMFLGKPLMLEGVVSEDPQFTKQAARLKVLIEAANSERIARPFFALVTARKYPAYRIGDTLRIRGILQAPENYSDFDYVSYLSRDDIFSTMSFPTIEKVGEGGGSKLKLFLSQIKYSFEEKIDFALPEPHAAFLKGLLLGERESLPEDLVEKFNRTGTTHIVALSGYNITLVGSFFVGILLLLTVPFRVAFWIATATIILFVMLTGASPSVVRAGIMGILVLIAQREGRMYHMTNALAFAGAVMIMHNPKILRFDTAFQLSFLATLGLVYVAPRLEFFMQRFRRSAPLLKKDGEKESSIGRSLKKILLETLSAQIMVLPLLIYVFGRVSLVSPLTNLLILIAVPYAMSAGFLAGIFGFLLAPLGRIAGGAAWVVLEYQMRVIDLFSRIPFASVEIPSFAALFALLLPLWVLWRVKQAKKARGA